MGVTIIKSSLTPEQREKALRPIIQKMRNNVAAEREQNESERRRMSKMVARMRLER